MRSMLGGRYPMMPLLLQLMLNQPMSSLMMKRMLGFLPAAAMGGTIWDCRPDLASRTGPKRLDRGPTSVLTSRSCETVVSVLFHAFQRWSLPALVQCFRL